MPTQADSFTAMLLSFQFLHFFMKLKPKPHTETVSDADQSYQFFQLCQTFQMCRLQIEAPAFQVLKTGFYGPPFSIELPARAAPP